MIDKANPNPAHKALSDLNIPVITMNIDGLHQRSGSRDEDVIEIHGNIQRVSCPKCKDSFHFSVTMKSILCPKCKKTVLEPQVVLYGDPIPRLGEALELIKHMDTLIIVGTSFYTSTAHYIKDAAESIGISVHTINEKAETVLPALLKELYKGEI
ncbi:hypothetical protein IWB18_07470 [Alkalibacter sp. M17DMB]|nr:hypothetical protein [Alkalibacter mobilis]